MCSASVRCSSGLLVLALGLCCAPEVDEEPQLRLLDFRQAGRSGVALNEELVFQFSAELDRASVTHATVRILGPDGEPVAGEFSVRRATLTFRPTLPKRPDLSDGGFSPGVRYSVELLGFPRPDGLRDRRGSVLSASFATSFLTASEAGSAPLFADPFLEQPSLLSPSARRIGPLDPIEFVFGEAIDPRTLLTPVGERRDFELASSDGERVELRLELVENRRDRAVLWLRPLSTEVANLRGLRALEEGEYFLSYRRDARLKTLGGRRVLHSWGPELLRILVIEPRPETLVEDFDTVTFRGLEHVQEADGTARWGGDGTVRIRFPVEAGSGQNGVVRGWPKSPIGSAGASWDPSDVHASRLVLPEGASWDLSQERGLVVLRSQGALEIRGTLRRNVRPDTPALGESLRGEDRRLLADAGPLGAWLERAAADGHDWTVLIAGGELRVSGAIELDGPLLLIAGGWIRVEGRVEAPEIWKSPEGGENVVADDRVRVAPFAWTEPTENPLVEPLRFAVLSGPLRPEGALLRWGRASVDGEAGAGRYRVRFLGLRDFGASETELFGPLDDPTLLGDCPAVRFLVELEMDPSEGAWNPPRVDRVALQWSAIPPSAQDPGRGPER